MLQRQEENREVLHDWLLAANTINGRTKLGLALVLVNDGISAVGWQGKEPVNKLSLLPPSRAHHHPGQEQQAGKTKHSDSKLSTMSSSTKDWSEDRASVILGQFIPRKG